MQGFLSLYTYLEYSRNSLVFVPFSPVFRSAKSGTERNKSGTLNNVLLSDLVLKYAKKAVLNIIDRL
jgi:hypothetical protein